MMYQDLLVLKLQKTLITNVLARQQKSWIIKETRSWPGYRKLRNNDDNTIETVTNLPWVNKPLYDLEYHDGTSAEITANIIADDILPQVNRKGYQQQILSEICYQYSDGAAIKCKYGFIKYKNGNIHCKITTCGWNLIL